MTYRIITVQFAVPHDDPCYHLTNMRDEIQEGLFDAHGWNGSFNIVGAKECRGGEGDAHGFDQEAFDAATVVPNADQIITQEVEAMDALFYCVDGVMPDDTLGADEEARAPYQVFDIEAQTYIPGEFETRPEAEVQAARMNAARRKRTLESIAMQRRYEINA